MIEKKTIDRQLVETLNSGSDVVKVFFRSFLERNAPILLGVSLGLSLWFVSLGVVTALIYRVVTAAAEIDAALWLAVIAVVGMVLSSLVLLMSVKYKSRAAAKPSLWQQNDAMHGDPQAL